MHGRASRAKFALIVTVDTLILHNLDRLLASALNSGRSSGTAYLGLFNLLRIGQALTHYDKRALAFMVLAMVPCLWVLIAVTLKRLNDLETTRWYVFL